MPRIKAKAGTDAAQLRSELAPLVPPESVTQVNGDVFVDVPEGVDEAHINTLVQRHFPRGLVRAIANIDFEGAASFEQLKAACIQMRTLTVRALRARWE